MERNRERQNQKLWCYSEILFQGKLTVQLNVLVCSGSNGGTVVRAPASTTNVALVCILVSTPYTVCGLSLFLVPFSPLLQEVFLRVLQSSPLLKNQYFQIPIWSGTHGRVSTSSYEGYGHVHTCMVYVWNSKPIISPIERNLDFSPQWHFTIFALIFVTVAILTSFFFALHLFCVALSRPCCLLMVFLIRASQCMPFMVLMFYIIWHLFLRLVKALSSAL